jgi:hypothetical protein
MGQTNAVAGFLRRLLTATCMSVAAARGAYASTFLESSAPALDSSTTILSANLLPDGTVIVNAPLSTSDTTCVVLFSNLTPNPAFAFTASSGNASPGLEAFDGSKLPFTPQLDEEIFGAGSVTFPAEAPHSGILSAGLELDEKPGNFAIGLDARDAETSARDAETSDSTTLTLTGLGLALAGTVGRGIKVLRRLKARENRPARLGPAAGIAL